MSNFLWILLFLTFKSTLCTPKYSHQRAQAPHTDYLFFTYPSEQPLEEKNETKTLQIYTRDWIIPVKPDNRRVAKFAEKLNKFHQRVTDAVLANNPGRNVIYSPISVSMLLMMIALGSRGRTSNEIYKESGLGFDLNSQMGFQELINIMKSHDKVDLEFANIIFASKKVDIALDYRNRANYFLQSGFQSLDFENKVFAAKQINNWCNEQTKTLIPEIVKPDDLNDVVMMLANAIYFKGDWLKPFDIADTKHNEPFHVSPTQTVPVTMMYMSANFNHGFITELMTQFIELPYMHNEDDEESISMYLLVPRKHDGLPLLEKNLNLIDFKRLNTEEDNVHIYLPRFKIQSNLNIKPIFEKMGMKSMFSQNADFRGLLKRYNREAYINKIVQKASLTVDEKGSTGAAVSVADFADRMSASVIKADKPFILAIVLKRLGVPLFYARVVNPTQSE